LFAFTRHIIDDLHPIFSHFPIALLVLAVVLSVAGRWIGGLKETTWILLIFGALSALVSSATGIIAHFPYEETSLATTIEQHQNLGLATTALFLLLTIWRWLARRKGSDNGTSWCFLACLSAGLLFMALVGGTGGSLVYDHGANVRGVNPLLKR
jgi:uncharacterized membrane protein